MHINEILRITDWNSVVVCKSVYTISEFHDIRTMDIGNGWFCEFEHNTGQVLALVSAIHDNFYYGATPELDTLIYDDAIEHFDVCRCEIDELVHDLRDELVGESYEIIPLDFPTESLAIIDDAADKLGLSRNEYMIKIIIDNLAKI